ncbi:MAG TPA: LD-carboxypeptidase [Chthonomonadaceae bacterium]|nr:LD-carboxypeptidase [Chthonomonadaceae bacterium]
MVRRRPRALRPGDTLGVASPSGPIEAEALQAGVAALEARGYRVVLGEHVRDTHPHNNYLAGTDADRAADLNALFAREDIAGILCARGGYGAMRLMDHLDWQAIATHPKVFVGFSDITSLHLALERHADLVTFHGPTLFGLPKLDLTAAGVFWQLLESPEPFGPLPAPPETIQTLVPGSVEGEMAGGCLCLLAHACGSSFAPDFRGKIVLIEDVNEAIYRADRDLTQLKNAGLLEEAAGFVIGALSDWPKHEDDPPRNTPEALWRDIFVPLGKPTIAGFPFGHVPNALTLPLGVRARLDADARTLTLLEPATR